MSDLHDDSWQYDDYLQRQEDRLYEIAEMVFQSRPGSGLDKLTQLVGIGANAVINLAQSERSESRRQRCQKAQAFVNDIAARNPRQRFTDRQLAQRAAPEVDVPFNTLRRWLGEGALKNPTPRLSPEHSQK
jgi:hypothetical protein